jgi:hypothetical protein
LWRASAAATPSTATRAERSAAARSDTFSAATALKLIERLPSLVRPGGQLLLTTPCTWLEDFTPRGNWPQGSTREWLTSLLEPHFDLFKTCDMPFLIREHARKYQWSVALGMRWRRKISEV